MTLQTTQAEFSTLSDAVHSRYQEISKDELFVVDVPDIFEEYLRAFPEGSDPIFRERTEHDCSCCKQFVRRLGTVVSIAPRRNTQHRLVEL